MTEQREWRDAKIPQWAKDSVEAEIAAYKLTAALSWPTEAKPTPLPFRWTDYDKLIGEPAPGCYCAALIHGIKTFELDHSKNIQLNDGSCAYKAWAFRPSYSVGWTMSVIRGPLFNNERDARLYMLWLNCEKYAIDLMRMRDML